MKVIIVKIINIDATAQDAGTVNVLSNGTPLNVSISIGKVTQSEFLVTTHDAPNSPNDIAIDRLGRIWFTNPWNGGNIDPSEKEELDNKSVLRGDPQADGTFQLTRVTFDTTMPNGILVSPDGNTLYVAESNSDNNEIDRELRAYPILDQQ